MSNERSAFPTGITVGDCASVQGGLTKKELITSMLVQGMIASGDSVSKDDVIRATYLADDILELAESK